MGKAMTPAQRNSLLDVALQESDRGMFAERRVFSEGLLQIAAE
jgi:hypothetical protein